MATFKFKLDKETIFLHYRQGKNEFRYYTKFKCEEKDWDDDKTSNKKGVKVTTKGKYRVKGNSLEAIKINNALDDIENSIKSILTNEKMIATKEGRDIDFQKIKSDFNAIYKKQVVEQSKKQTIFDLFDDYLTIRAAQITEVTAKVYRRVRKNLSVFCKSKNVSPNISQIDLAFFLKYQKYLIEDMRYKNITINVEIKKIKEVLRFYEEYKIFIPNNKQLKKLKEADQHRFTMTYEESKLFYNVDFKDAIFNENDRSFKISKNILEAVRDCYIFSFYTGIPYQPLCQLTENNIHTIDIVDEKTTYRLGDLLFDNPNELMSYLSNNGKFLSNKNISYSTESSIRNINIIEYHRDKSKKTLVTPLNDICLKIIEKYRGKQTKLLPMMTNQRMNFYIHIALKQSGLFNQEIIQINYNGTNIVEKVTKRYEAITFHSARHGFASYLISSGLPIAFIQKLLGHSDIKTTQIYAKANANDVLKKAFELLK